MNSGTLEAAAAIEGVAELTKCPHDLHVLWNEWEVGVGLNKPAAERGCVSRRLKFWRCMERLISAGCSFEVSFRRIYAVYSGPTKRVSYILKAMHPHHEANGGHHMLLLLNQLVINASFLLLRVVEVFSLLLVPPLISKNPIKI